MNPARQAILARLRAGQSTASVTDTQEPAYTAWTARDPAEQMAQFCEQLTASHAEVYHCTSDTLSEQLAELISETGVRRIAAGTAGEFLAQIQHACRTAELVPFDDPIDNWKDTLFSEVDAGVTHVHAAIAETGTLVLWPDRKEPRTLSLVPPCHIALVNASQLTDNFTALMHQQQWHQGLPTNVVLISGPSKTADIQQTLAYGAHGPSRLMVLIVVNR
ncbi:lactate utilization protein [Photobacterium sp. CCB-ST2H9]|uniref:LutC/YkgG family protein n=1 Tax=Photobacterium sp. CCB-ST2H9 TaxID=2912855 RepID=UPI0020050623|nr:lactate utilization protein C [Photobacterium sp. CCB-ST2H9]UTM59641.1 lactate utilization protein [Photobacterium sp. CCB-ST2H9]